MEGAGPAAKPGAKLSRKRSDKSRGDSEGGQCAEAQPRKHEKRSRSELAVLTPPRKRLWTTRERIRILVFESEISSLRASDDTRSLTASNEGTYLLRCDAPGIVPTHHALPLKFVIMLEGQLFVAQGVK